MELWLRFIAQQEQRDRVTDLHLMQIAAEVRVVIDLLSAGKSSGVSPEDFRLRPSAGGDGQSHLGDFPADAVGVPRRLTSELLVRAEQQLRLGQALAASRARMPPQVPTSPLSSPAGGGGSELGRGGVFLSRKSPLNS